MKKETEYYKLLINSVLKATFEEKVFQNYVIYFVCKMILVKEMEILLVLLLLFLIIIIIMPYYNFYYYYKLSRF